MNEIKYCCCCGRLLDDLKKECKKHGTYDRNIQFYRYEGHLYSANIDEVYPAGGIEYCEYCGAKLNDEDLIVEVEHHEFHDAPCSEEMIVGYKCKSCGIEERF